MLAKAIPKPDFMEQADWDLLMSTRDPAIIKAGAGAHAKRYLELNGGDGTYITQGAATLVLATTGRKTGNEVLSPANFMEEEGSDVLYIVGSIAGMERHPNWALNLEARPEAWVQVKAKRWDVVAHKLAADERAALWPRLIDFFPLWGHFQKYCDREFMVFGLSPKEK